MAEPILINPLGLDDYSETYSLGDFAHAHCTQLSSVKGEKGMYTIHLLATVPSKETRDLGPKLVDWTVSQLEVESELTLEKAAQSVLRTRDVRLDAIRIHSNSVYRFRQLTGLERAKWPELSDRARKLIEPHDESDHCGF